MEQAKYRVVFHGRAVDGGTMPVEDVAPSLLAFAGLLQTATHQLSGSEARLTVAISAPEIRRGSFDVLLVLGFAASTISAFGPDKLKVIADSIQVIFGQDGLLALLKMLGGRTPDEVKTEEDGSAKVRIGDVSLHIGSVVFNMATDQSVNKRTTTFVSPLLGDGVDSVAVSDGSGNEIVAVKKKDAQSIAASRALPLPILESMEQTFRTLLHLARPALEHDLTWDVRMGEEQPITKVHIEDEAFLGEVASGARSFNAGTILDVTLTCRQEVRPGGSLRLLDMRVVKVHRVIPTKERPQRGLFPPGGGHA